MNTVFDMPYSRSSTCHVLLLSTSFIFMINSFVKHIFDTMFMHFLFASNLWNKFNMKIHIFLTIQKREYSQFSSVGFASMLKPPPFEGPYYKRWCQKTTLWLTSMRCFYVLTDLPATV